MFGQVDKMVSEGNDVMLSETTPFNPISPYAVSKVSAFYLCKYYRQVYGLKIVTAIGFNHESPFRN